MTQHQSLDRIRTDIVGSFLRPPQLKEARAKLDHGQATEDDLREEQDRAVQALIAKEEALGLPVVTDGELRRDGFQNSFAAAVSGINVRSTATPMADTTPGSRTEDPTFDRRVVASERLSLISNVPLAEYRFADNVATRPVKVTLLGPGRIMQRFDADGSRDVYQDIDEFLADVVAIERRIVQELVDAGCRYIQLDEPSYTAYVDPAWLAAWRARGEDPDEHLERAIRADNAIMAGFPGVTFGVHVCRGNRQSMYHREGSYDAIAERVLGGLACQRLLLEYDTERAGGFEPLRFVPKGTVAVLGLVTTKVGEIEDAGTLRRRIDDAARYLPLEQLALSPQCGFASSFPGNALTEDEQWRKVELVQSVARQTWE